MNLKIIYWVFGMLCLTGCVKPIADDKPPVTLLSPNPPIQAWNRPMESLHFENLTVNDGLSSNQITCLFTDKKGFLWIGTTNGLNRYDGKTFKIYKQEKRNPNSILDNRIRDINEDSQGNIWATSERGFNKIQPNGAIQSIEFEFDNSSAMLIDFKGRIWMTRGQNTGYFDTLKRVYDTIVPHVKTLMQEDSKHNLFTVMDGNILKYQAQEKQFKKVKKISPNENHSYYKLIIDNFDNLFLFGKDSIMIQINLQNYEIKQYNWQDPKYSLTYIKELESCFAINEFGAIGRYRFKDTTAPQLYSHNISDNFITTTMDKNYNLWIGSASSGLWKYVATEHKILELNPYNPIEALTFDADNNLWLRSFEYRGDAFPVVYSIVPFSTNHSVAAATIKLPISPNLVERFTSKNTKLGFSKGHHAFFMQRLTDFDKYHNRYLKQLNIKNGVTQNLNQEVEPMALKHDSILLHNSAIIFHNNKAIYNYDPIHQTLSMFDADTLTNILKPNHYCDFYQDRQKKIWFHAQNSTTLWNIDTTQGDMFDKSVGSCLDSLKFNKKVGKISHFDFDEPINTCFEDSKSRFWVGTSDGLFMFKNDNTVKNNSLFKFSFQYLNEKFADLSLFKCLKRVFDNESIVKMLKTVQSNFLWGAGIRPHPSPSPSNPYGQKDSLSRKLIKSNRQVVQVPSKDKLVKQLIRPNNLKPYQKDFANISISAIEEDKHGLLWISTNDDGLLVFDPNQERIIKRFGQKDGLVSSHFSPNISSTAPNGYMVFGNEHHFNVFHPDSLIWNGAPTVEIVGVSANEVPQNYANGLILPHHLNNLSINASVMDFSNPRFNQIRFKLDGWDTHFSAPTTESNIVYRGLAPGTYTLLVHGANSDEVWTTQPTMLKIQIVPPFWRTWWFESLALGMLLYSIYRIWRFFQARQLAKIVAERTATHEKMAFLEAQMRQTQLHPHFLFNVLTGVQSKIWTQSASDANAILVKLADLMRGFLESAIGSSKHDGEIYLNQEIELIKSYIDFECIKNEHRFQWDVTYEQIYPQSEKIPPFLIQPYVENAIKHGILLRNDHLGRLKVAFHKKMDTDGEPFLICIVTDNGVGRTRANEIRQKDPHNHVSRGRELTEERMKYLNKYIYNIHCETIDNQPSGTIVTIQIKYKLN